jgi:hypothetical protein
MMIFLLRERAGNRGNELVVYPVQTENVKCGTNFQVLRALSNRLFEMFGSYFMEKEELVVRIHPICRRGRLGPGV